MKRTKPAVRRSGAAVKRKLTDKERAKGRSEGYWEMSSEDQWAEDKRLGILDWDGK